MRRLQTAGCPMDLLVGLADRKMDRISADEAPQAPPGASQSKTRREG
jgi:hypothetical protein